MKNNRNTFLSFAAMAVVLATFVACGKVDYDTSAPTFARVKIFHMLADSAAVNVDALVDGTKINLRTGIADTLKYGGSFPADSTYMRFADGARNFKINPFGATAGFTGDVTLAAGGYYSVFATDSLPSVGALVIKDDPFLPPVQGKILVRLVNLAPNAPSYDLFVKGGSVVQLDAKYKVAPSFFGYADIPVGNDTLKLDIRLNGTTTIVSTVNIVKPVSGRIFTIATKGYVGGRKASYRLSTSTFAHAR